MSTTREIHHIAGCVENIQKATEFFSLVLGLKSAKIFEDKDLMMIVAQIKFGKTTFELMQTTDPNGFVAKRMRDRGPGLDHICLRVKRIDQLVNKLRNNKIPIVDPLGRPIDKPLAGRDGARYVYLMPEHAAGIRLQLIETSSTITGAKR